MGVTYKLKEEVVRFIVSERQSNPLFSCRQLAESASQKFDLHLSKSSVHDVLKEAGIITPRGRKPKDKFAIPHEKKKQIQQSLSQVKFVPLPESHQHSISSIVESEVKPFFDSKEIVALPEVAASPVYEGAGKIFLKAALWDLGIFSEDKIKEGDWKYYLTYVKGIKVNLEDGRSFFIDLPLPIERCIREVTDGLINNVRTFKVDKVSDRELFKACMDAQEGFKMNSVSIVGYKEQLLLETSIIMEYKRKFLVENMLFVESYEKESMKRAEIIFFSQSVNTKYIIDNIISLKGFDTISKDELIVNLIVDSTFDNKIALQGASERLNGMRLYDEQARLLKVKIQG